jgi:hypothetical protein
MKHLTEEQLLAYRDGEMKDRDAIAAHLRECPECREEQQKLEAVFAALDAMPVPNPGDNYEQRVWQQLTPKLPEKHQRWWEGIFQTRRLAAVGVMAALVLLAFLAGRITKKGPAKNDIADASKVRQRVLLVAVGNHLGRSEMILVELANTMPDKGQKKVDISAEQKRAEELVEENRLYRQTALKEGDTAMASTLEELERVLLDVANSPDEITPSQFESLQRRIESKGILFKVRVVNQDLQKREKAAQPSPAQDSSAEKERNKA